MIVLLAVNDTTISNQLCRANANSLLSKQRQTAVTAHFSSEQLLLLAFACQN